MKASNNTILFCDDDEGILDVVSIILSDKGYNVEALLDSRKVYNQIRVSKPMLIILDLWMPNLSGEEITRELKKNKATQNIPVIILSASKDTPKIAKKIGADNFISKPFDISVLEEMVAKYASS